MQESLTQTQSEPNYVDQLVGEGKKYKTADELAKAYINADSHIKTLSNENTTLSAIAVEKDMEAENEKATTRRKVEALLEEAKKKGNTNNPERPGTDPRPTPAEKDITEVVNNAVKDTLTKLGSEADKANNLKAAKQMLIQTYGSEDSYNQAFESYISLGEMTRAEVDEMAKSKPNLIHKLITSSVPPKPGTPNPVPNFKGPKTFNDPKVNAELSFGSYWKKLLLTDRAEYDRRKPELHGLIAEYQKKGIDFLKT